MAFYSNLICDSILVEEAVCFLKSSDKRAAASEIAAYLLDSDRVDPKFGALFVADLLRHDPRFRFHGENFVELVLPEFERRKLNECDFVVFDTETTGAKAGHSRMTEIGAYRVSGGKIVDEFQTLVNPEMPIPAHITQLTGISDSMAARAPLFADVAPDLLNFFGDSVLVAHNADFDMAFLNYEIRRVYGERKLINHNLCTVRLSRKLLPNIQNYKLHTVAEYFSIQICNRHRAAGDALATAQIFVRLLQKLNEKGVTDIASIKTFIKR
jgi:DNA polymerase III epsilon subunit family exonuclease